MAINRKRTYIIPAGSNTSKERIYRAQVKFGGHGKWFYLDLFGFDKNFQFFIDILYKI